MKQNMFLFIFVASIIAVAGCVEQSPTEKIATRLKESYNNGVSQSFIESLSAGTVLNSDSLRLSANIPSDEFSLWCYEGVSLICAGGEQGGGVFGSPRFISDVQQVIVQNDTKIEVVYDCSGKNVQGRIDCIMELHKS